MYSGNYGGGGFRLYLQRSLCSYRSFVVIFVVFLCTIFLYYYNESVSLLKAREIEWNRCQLKLDSISAQLQVVYEHKSRLEKALLADKEACTKRVDDITKNLKTVQGNLDKSQAELKVLQPKHLALEKELSQLQADRNASQNAISRVNQSAALLKDQYAKEVEQYKGENAKLNALAVQLQTALNKTLVQVAFLQQQLDQQRQLLAYSQQQQQHQAHPQPQPAISSQPSYNAVAERDPVQVPNNLLPVVQPATTQPALGAPLLAGGGQVPPANGAPVPRPATAVVQPQPEQVAVPMAEHQQQQLLAQRQVPIQQPQQVIGVGQQAAAPAPVLQQPLGEAQQQLLMVRNVANAPAGAAPALAAAAAAVPPVVQAPPVVPFPAPQPLQQQAPLPAQAVVAQPNHANVVPPPAAVPDADFGAGAGAIYHDAEAVERQFDQRMADDYKDDEEENNRHKDFQ